MPPPNTQPMVLTNDGQTLSVDALLAQVREWLSDFEEDPKDHHLWEARSLLDQLIEQHGVPTWITVSPEAYFVHDAGTVFRVDRRYRAT